MKRYLKIIVAFSVLAFLIQFASIESMHNHNLDLNRHYDCPAFVLSTTLLSFFFTILFIYNSSLSFSDIFEPIKSPQRISSIIVASKKDRAPPF